MRTYFIYKYTFPNNKSYIGQTFHGSGRFGQTACYSNQLVQKAMLKFPNFKKEILEDNLTAEIADIREQFWISYFKTTDISYGYNLDSGGHALKQHSQSTKEKIKAGNIGKHVGYKHTDEAKAKMHKKHNNSSYLGKNNHMFGKVISEETKLKIKEKLIGKLHTDEHKEKISLACKQRWGKKIVCIETGQCFDSITDAAKWCNGKRSVISLCCKGKVKTSYGYHWKYLEEDK